MGKACKWEQLLGRVWAAGTQREDRHQLVLREL